MNAPLGDAPQSLTGLHVVDAEGAKVGRVQQVYRDDATNEPEWITVRTGLFGMKESFIPLAGARRTGDELHVPHTKATIKDAPRIDANGHLDPSEEAELYRHYGMARPAPGAADQGGPESRPRPTGDTAPPASTGGERNKLIEGPMAGAGSGAGTRSGPQGGDTARGKEQLPETGADDDKGGRAHPGDDTGGRREGPDRPR
ncbi:PRC-barrel domain-containing protein [Streptomyces sp. NPDC058773]|uniref:PRC-barrel domain-containing protein n=1 Tax=Streptomyces sp. NPDC058773 TaxID=3346632 RepID=UPI0036CF0E36